MQNLRLSDLAWIAFGLLLYLVATSSLPGAIYRQVQLLFGRSASPARRARPRLRRVMSRSAAGSSGVRATENAQTLPYSPVKRNGETAGNGVAISETEGNDPFPFPDLFTGLARLVLDKKIGETDAIKIAIKVAPGKGDKYQEARRRLHAAMEREQPPAAQYRELSPEQESMRAALRMKQKGVLN